MIAFVQTYVFLALFLLVFAASAIALVDALMRPTRAFAVAGKRTKTFWTWLLVAAAVVAFISVPIPGFPSFGLSFLALGSAAAAIVYLVDVRPAVAPYSGRRGGSGSRSGW